MSVISISLYLLRKRIYCKNNNFPISEDTHRAKEEAKSPWKPLTLFYGSQDTGHAVCK